MLEVTATWDDEAQQAPCGLLSPQMAGKIGVSQLAPMPGALTAARPLMRHTQRVSVHSPALPEDPHLAHVCEHVGVCVR